MSRARKLSFFGAILPLLLVVLAFIGFTYWRQIVDRYQYMTYEPSAQIAELAQSAKLHNDGLFYFYASQPVLEGTQAFNSYCNRSEEKSAILGCYDGYGIYIFDVTDDRLQGVEEVTAAHEMLHAAYDRLSDREKKSLEPLLDAEYERVKNDELTERMAYYDRNEPGQHYNELHSIIATEFTGISSELEEHYDQYFSDRSAVVRLHESYKTQFDSVQQQISTLAEELNQLADRINTTTNTYNQQSAQLNADIEAFNRRVQSGAYSSQARFDADRNALVERSESLSVDRQRIEDDIALYERKRTEYITLSNEAQTLQQSIDSSLAPAPAI